jgi:hypothetical protein
MKTTFASRAAAVRRNPIRPARFICRAGPAAKEAAMQGEPWARRGRDEPYRTERRFEREDYGQADYSTDFGYDPETRTGYRRDGRYDEPAEPRSFNEHRHALDPRDHRRAAMDRRIWAEVEERLARDRRVDASDVEVRVEAGVVFLNGTARTREGKRRIEQMADTDGVVDVVNSLRVREREKSGWFHW